jgi:hypothetical protein
MSLEDKITALAQAVGADIKALQSSGGGDFVAITENGKTGYGTSYRAANPAYYGDIGNNAIDFSFNDTESTLYGATGGSSRALGGYRARASGSSSFVFGAYSTGSGASSIAIGDACTASNSYAIAMGESCYATSANSIAIGNNCRADGENSIALGKYASANLIRSKLAIGASSTLGKVQTGVITLGDVTTDATTKTLTSSQSAVSTANQLILPNNAAQAFRGLVVADGTGMAASWEITGLVRRGSNASSIVLVGSAVTKMYGDAGLDACLVSFSVDTINGGVRVNVRGLASTTINWTCSIWTAEAI